MTENNLPVKSPLNELVRYNVGLVKYTNSLIFTLNKEELFKEAINCFKQENYHEAYLKFYRIYQYYPVSKGLYPYLAYCAYKMGNKDKIEFFLWKDFELKVVDVYQVNRRMLNNKQWSTLMKELSVLESIENLLIKIYLNLIIENNDVAEKAWNRIKEEDFLDKQYWFYHLSGDINFVNKRFSEALIDYTKAIELDSGNAIAYYNRGVLKKNRNNNLGAIEDYTKAIELDSHFAFAYYNRGFAKSHDENFEDIEDYTKAIELDPNLAHAYSLRGNRRAFTGDLKGALADLSKAIELKPFNSYDDLYSIAFVYRELKDYDSEITVYSTLLELNPKRADYYWRRANAKYLLEDFKGAIIDYTKSIELNPSDANTYQYRCNAYVKLGNLFEAKKDFEIYESLKK